MRLNSIHIQNYKGFRDSSAVTLGRHWTVVVGQNNAGKTAFLECFRFSNFTNKPYASIEQLEGAARNPFSSLILSVEIKTKELTNWSLVHNQSLQFPVPSAAERSRFLSEHFFKSEHLLLECMKTGGNDWRSTGYPSHRLFALGQGASNFSSALVPNADRQSLRIEPLTGSADNLVEVVGGILSNNVYVFNSERRIQPRSNPQANLNLESDASNLAGALNRLMTTNYKRFEEFMTLVTLVLPNVEMIAIPPADNNPNQVQIKVYNNGFAEKRDDLAIPLEECGTGIGQVLAILFVVVTATTGRILVIDEPNSFLHPGASRELLKLLRSPTFSRHQFIVTTHSPEIIAVAQPEELLIIRWQEDQSEIDILSGTDVARVQTSLREVGVRLSDVYGYDAIVWVEGPTEERCFPKLFEATGRSIPPRTEFVAVVNTGDFDGPNAETYWRAYERLSAKSALVPETVAISLDREGKTEKLCKDVRERSKNLMHFLPRRTYENYLLHPPAIANILGGLEQKIFSPEEIANWIENKRAETRYFTGEEARRQQRERDWIVHIDAPKLLNDLWSHFTEHRHDFDGRKVECSTALTVWLLENAPEQLEELISYVGTLVPEAA